MKTAVSIPDEIFVEADRLAKRAKKSRSEVYSAALREYLARHSSDEITAAMNKTLDEVGEAADDFVLRATRRTLRKVEW